ncbi:hypothetical protein EJ04DRAFT_178563 [Polyplosphaeria fusca]|uniref:Uncharacterized protein n=1 Tax=Polyplosphaeria fusca TaxID=682080 RepID=A0A9P4R2S4_9PLEO|nr:hypothetical protein EJ04DRAFT_178563 [Polyplosphaeria fusca]
MCKVVRYRFACLCTYRFRYSVCRGTKHKHRESGTVAACSSEAYILINKDFDCGKCRKKAWEQACEERRARADEFLEQLKVERSPVANEIAEIIGSLDVQHETWGSENRELFLPSGLRYMDRAAIHQKVVNPSWLRQEVLPEDVVLERKPATFLDEEPKLEFNAFGCPVTFDATYTHPLDDLDSASLPEDHIIHQYTQSPDDSSFSPAPDDSAFATDFDAFDANPWTWTSDSTPPSPQDATTPWAPSTPSSPLSPTSHAQVLSTTTHLLHTTIGPCPTSPPTSYPTRTHSLSPTLNITNYAFTPFPDLAPTSQNSNFVDGATEQGKKTKNNARAEFDNYRARLHAGKVGNEDWFYAKWLEVSRVEVQRVIRKGVKL